MMDIFFLKKQRYYYVLPTLTLCDEIKADERGGSYTVQEDCRVKRQYMVSRVGREESMRDQSPNERLTRQHRNSVRGLLGF